MDSAADSGDSAYSTAMLIVVAVLVFLLAMLAVGAVRLYRFEAEHAHRAKTTVRMIEKHRRVARRGAGEEVSSYSDSGASDDRPETRPAARNMGVLQDGNTGLSVNIGAQAPPFRLLTDAEMFYIANKR